ncbi:MAG: starch synthase [Hydrogenophilales bacterium 28-61-23]|nr:MAG: starch synthase [Hydrogenophilales bacterium 28-61-23]
MNVLYATSEAAPLIKTGGLADVSGALPAALRKIGIDCRVLIPGYPAVMYKLEATRQVARFDHFLDAKGKPLAARLLLSSMPGSGTPLYVLDAPSAFARGGGPYSDSEGLDYPDNAHRFALLSQVAALLAGAESPLDWRPDILHCNDWQTGLAPAYLRLSGSTTPAVITVHNLAYQGIFPPETVTELNLPAHAFSIEGIEYYGNLSFLKAGLYYANHITTVSPSYALEIQQPYLGMGMQGLLASRQNQLSGILNGIDTDEWNPSADPHLPSQFSARALSGKKTCKHKLQEELGLEPLADAPLFGMIARMTHQKGLDLVLAVADGIIDRGGQIAFLGTGEKSIESAVTALVELHPGQVAAKIGYNESLSHRIEAGSDIFLMPSLFEPCGLNQMYSMRYGSLPIVHATGGLRDTVEDGVTGFVFYQPTPHALWLAVERALDLYAQKPAWKKLMQAGMSRDFSWEKSALAYQALYRELLPEPLPEPD